MADVLVAGGVFRELLIGPAGREPRLAGSGLYAAMAAARAGAQVELVAPIGDEDRPTADALCAGAGVRSHWLSVGAESPTFVLDAAWWRPPRPQYKPAGPPQKLPSSPAHAPVVLMFGHPEWDPQADENLAALTVDAEILWDRQGWLSRSHTFAASEAPAARRILLSNVGELAAALEIEPAALEGREPPALYDAWVIKDGPWGVHVRERGLPLSSEGARRVHPRASIGSGDVFAGALAAARARGDSLPSSVEAGMEAAAVALISPNPLNPSSPAPTSLRPPVLPSQRTQLRGTLRAGPRWAARALAEELSAALGISVEATAEPSAARELQLQVRNADGRSGAVAAYPAGWDELVEQLAFDGLDLAASLVMGDRS